MSFDHTLKKGTTSKIIEFILRDSTTGQGKTGLATGDMSGAYVREGGTHTSLSFSAGSAGDAYTSGKWAEVDSTNMAGVYQFHLPNAVLASGADSVTIRFGASGVIDKIIRISLLDVDLRDADNAGLADVAAILVDTGTTIPALFPTNFDSMAITASGKITVGTNDDKTGYSISGSVTTLDGLNDIAATDIVSGGAITTSGGAVSNVTTVATTTTNSDMRGTDSALLASSAPTNWSSFVLDGSGRVTVIANADKTGYSISGTKQTLDDLTDISAAQVNAQVDTALSDIGLDHLVSASVTGTDIADDSIVASLVSKEATADWDDFDNTTDSLQAIRDRGDSSWTPSGGLTAADIADAVLDEALSDHTSAGSLGKAIADIESDADAILTDTGTSIPASLTTIDDEIAVIDANVDAIKSDTGSSIPTTITTLTNKVDAVDTVVDAILVDTGTTIPTTLSGLSTLDASGVRSAVGLASANLDTQLSTIDGNVDSILVDTGTTIPTQITDLNDLDAASVRSAVGLATANLDTQLTTIDGNVDAILVDTGTTIPDQITALEDAAAIADAVWDESLSAHNSAGSTGKALKQLKEGVITAESQVNDAAATTTTFITDLTEATDGFYHDKVLVFTSGDLLGQARHIETYNGTTKSITVSQAFTSAPADDAEFLILAGHEHSLDEIADSVWDELRSGHTNAGSFGYYLDARVSQAGGGGGASAADIWGALLTDYATAGTFGARFQEGRRYSNTTAQIIYINQGDAYDDTANNAITWAVSKDYSSADSLTITIEHRVTGATILSHAVTYTDATTLKLFLSTADTAFSTLTTDADFGVHPYRITADFAGEKQSVVRGAATIRAS